MIGLCTVAHKGCLSISTRSTHSFPHKKNHISIHQYTKLYLQNIKASIMFNFQVALLALVEPWDYIRPLCVHKHLFWWYGTCRGLHWYNRKQHQASKYTMLAGLGTHTGSLHSNKGLWGMNIRHSYRMRENDVQNCCYCELEIHHRNHRDFFLYSCILDFLWLWERNSQGCSPLRFGGEKKKKWIIKKQSVAIIERRYSAAGKLWYRTFWKLYNGFVCPMATCHIEYSDT